MNWKFILVLTASFVCGWAAVASAEDKTGSAPSVVSSTGMTQQIFEALAPDSTIEINGERITKRELIARQQASLKELTLKIQEWKMRVGTELDAHRKALLDSAEARREDDNKKVQAEVDRLVAADAAAHGPNWEARKKQALDLLDQADNDKASDEERSQLVTRAADLLAPMSPQHNPTGPKP